MPYPNITFKLNKELDQKMANAFWDKKAGGVVFFELIKKNHPKLEKKEQIDQYISSFYQKHNQIIIQKKVLIEKEWRIKEKDFFTIINKIFKNYPWPKGDYICYLSIFPFGPRFLENKTFQTCYKWDIEESIWQVSHEMLHFIFYDYVEHKFPLITKKVSNEQIWELSEIFNNIIQNLSVFKKVTNFSLPDGPYPQLVKKTKKFQLIWQEEKEDIDYFLQRVLV